MKDEAWTSLPSPLLHSSPFRSFPFFFFFPLFPLRVEIYFWKPIFFYDLELSLWAIKAHRREEEAREKRREREREGWYDKKLQGCVKMLRISQSAIIWFRSALGGCFCSRAANEEAHRTMNSVERQSGWCNRASSRSKGAVSDWSSCVFHSLFGYRERKIWNLNACAIVLFLLVLRGSSIVLFVSAIVLWFILFLREAKSRSLPPFITVFDILASSSSL